MKYLSLFSGIGGFELGINRVFPSSECVGYSEINNYAIKVYDSHYPNHTNFGDIQTINPHNLQNFDMIVGGFPCQDLSSLNVKGGKGLGGSRSGLFYNMLEIMHAKNPRWFCYENVASMKNSDKNTISQELGVEPIMIDAALVSGQRRKRLFRCNWRVNPPMDKGIFLKNILEANPNTTPLSNARLRWFYSEKTQNMRVKKGFVAINPQKANTLTARGELAWTCNYIEENNKVRVLSPIECERLQCFPDDWTIVVPEKHRYGLLGNAVNVEVVAHIMESLKQHIGKENT